MYRNGRGEDQDFHPREPLYRRVRQEDLAGESLLAAKIGYHQWSINRGKFSEPEDVAFGWDGCGVAQFYVEDVPAEVSGDTPGEKTYNFRPQHRPDEDNYAHSEIWAFREGLRVDRPNPSSSVKKKYRTMLSQRITIIRAPRI